MKVRTSTGSPATPSGLQTTPSHERGSPQCYAWLAATAVLIVCGVVTSTLGANAVARSDAAAAQQSLHHRSADVATTLALAIQREEDMIVQTGAFLAGPDVSQTEFVEWVGAARTFERFPEVAAIGLLMLVPRADLANFAARADRDPGNSSAADGKFEVVPKGTRSFYCLRSAGVARSTVSPLPAGRDYCSDPVALAALLAARDSGQGMYLPYTADGRTWLGIQTPVYDGDLEPTTVADRREAFAGWVGTQVDVSYLIREVLGDRPGLSLEMRYEGAGDDVVFSSSSRPAGTASEVVDLRNGWTAQMRFAQEPAGIARGNALWVLLTGIVISVLLGVLMFVLGTGRAHARRQLEQRTRQLQHHALHDALTGLPNRALVMDRAEQMLARDRRQHVASAALFLDLDDFKNVNDSLGHGAGDRLLIAVAARLSSVLRGEDTIGRLGGDEFVVLVGGSLLKARPDLVADRLLHVMREPFELDGVPAPLQVNVSIGIAAGDRGSAEELLRDADIALYQAKGAGKNRVEVFDPGMQAYAGRGLDLERDIRGALSNNEYRLVYQPIYDLDELTLVGVEALLRWDHAIHGPISPDEFIPILEQTGEIREVGRWVLLEACQQMATWHARGDTLAVSVNVSARQLDEDTITDDIQHTLRASGLDASKLIVEVTETALMCDMNATAGRLRAIKALGVRIAVDDFGTGYSSLAYLRELPVDCIKIDRAFTNAATASSESRALIGTVVQLGKDLGLSTLAEGVETTAELEILRAARVDQAQGFLMSRPLDPQALETLVLEPMRLSVPTLS